MDLTRLRTYGRPLNFLHPVLCRREFVEGVALLGELGLSLGMNGNATVYIEEISRENGEMGNGRLRGTGKH